MSWAYRLAFWIAFRIFLEILPEKARKILGSILLIFGAIAILWATSAEFDAWTGIVGIVAIFGGLFSIILGIDIWWGIFSGRWENFEDEEYITPESTLENPKQQIDCSSCSQKLNIPFSYTGMISCPACGIHMDLEEGEIQADETIAAADVANDVTFVENKELKVLKLDDMVELVGIIWFALVVIILIFSVIEYGFWKTFGLIGFTIIGTISFVLLPPVACIILGIVIMILSNLNFVKTDGDWGTLNLMDKFYSELWSEEK